MARSPDVSFCMIVRDGADTLEACLRSVAHLADEIVIVDTGSADDSPEIARAFGARVLHAKWQNDFAAARNAYVDAARCSWILSLDADEVLQHVERDVVLDALRARPRSAFLFTILNYFVAADRPEFVLPSELYGDVRDGIGCALSRTIRLFPRRAGVRYSYPVHESLMPALIRQGMTYARCAIPIHHTGSLAPRGRMKAALYKQLGLRKIAERPNYFLGYLELGKVHLHQGELADAERMFAQCVRLNPRCAQGYCCLALTLERAGRHAESHDLLRRALGRFPGNADLMHVFASVDARTVANAATSVA